MTLTRWRRNNGCGTATSRQTNSLNDELSQLFQAFGGVLDSPVVWSPAVDLYDIHDLVTVKAELPGLKKEDISITLQDGLLVLSGERTEPRTGATGRESSGFQRSFRRTIRLPYKVNAAAIKAAYVDGVLTVELPKAEEAKPKQIKIEFN